MWGCITGVQEVHRAHPESSSWRKGQEFLSAAPGNPPPPPPGEELPGGEARCWGLPACPALRRAELAPAALVGLGGREGQAWAHARGVSSKVEAPSPCSWTQISGEGRGCAAAPKPATLHEVKLVHVKRLEQHPAPVRLCVSLLLLVV